MFVEIQGKEYVLTSKMYQAMPYFKEDEALSGKNDCFKLPSTIITTKIWETIIKFLQKHDYYIPKLAKIKSNLKDNLDKEAIQLIESMRPMQINQLYKAVHFLKIPNFRMLIASYFANEVYICTMKKDYKPLSQKLQIKTQLSVGLILTYKQNEPNLN